MSRKYKKKMSDKEIARKNVKKQKIENEFVANLKFMLMMCVAFVLAGFVALQLYLSSQPPIKNFIHTTVKSSRHLLHTLFQKLN